MTPWSLIQPGPIEMERCRNTIFWIQQWVTNTNISIQEQPILSHENWSELPINVLMASRSISPICLTCSRVCLPMPLAWVCLPKMCLTIHSGMYHGIIGSTRFNKAVLSMNSHRTQTRTLQQCVIWINQAIKIKILVVGPGVLDKCEVLNSIKNGS